MSQDRNDFEQFMKRREEAAGAYVGGDAEPLARISARVSPATFFGPKGGFRQGAEEVSATYARDAEVFAPGAENHFEILQSGASGDIAYWVGFQRATAHMKGSPDAVPFNLRITEVFRREGGEWKLVHRHADPLASEESKEDKEEKKA
jgi:ketosteroid isomerase-like protein